MRSSKSRSRGKNRNNNNRPQGNIVNRVFDSSGPEGKVRGTPQQIIDKYQGLYRDAQLAGDRVNAENFQQHAEHYIRLLAAAQKEQDARREAQEAQQRERQKEREERDAQRDTQRDASRDKSERAPKDAGQSRQPAAAPADGEDIGLPRFVTEGTEPQPDVIDLDASEGKDAGLVETVESAPKPRKPRARKPKAEDKPAAE